MTPTRGRRLIWISIVHTETDLGSMAAEVRRLHVQKGGLLRWEQHRKAIEGWWMDVRQHISELNLVWSRVRLYQDGLPNCGQEVEIVESLARAGSLNHQLLQELVQRGATLVGTESPELLREEYALAGQSSKTANASRPHLAWRQQQQSQALLQKRDRYIARRIAETLASGETGLLFLGMLHVLPALPADIKVIRQVFASASTQTRTATPPPRAEGGKPCE